MLRKWLMRREAPTNFTHVAVTGGNLLAAVTFVLGGIKYFAAKEHEVEREEKQMALRAFDECIALARDKNPRVLLSEIKRQMLYNFQKHEQERNKTWWRREGTDLDELSDRWLQQRNAGKEWAVRIDDRRILLKNIWYSVMSAYQRYPNRVGSLGKTLYGEYPLGKEVAIKSLLLLEPLDKAQCRSNVSKSGPGECDWDKHCPEIYTFIRSVYNLPSSFPVEEPIRSRTELGNRDEIVKLQLEEEIIEKQIELGNRDEIATLQVQGEHIEEKIDELKSINDEIAKRQLEEDIIEKQIELDVELGNTDEIATLKVEEEHIEEIIEELNAISEKDCNL